VTVLSDTSLHQRVAAGLLSSPLPTAVGPASIDLHLGSDILIESAGSSPFVPYPFARHTADDPFLLRPGQFILADTAELIDLHTDLAGQVQLKSSLARLGLNHLMAGWIDPGFTGTITLELHNASQIRPIPLYPAMPIAQLILQLLDATPARSYAITGRYNNQHGPTQSLGIAAA